MTHTPEIHFFDPDQDTPDAMSLVVINPPQAWLDVLQERQRQVTAEGWTPEHDDQYIAGTMGEAAICYLEHATDFGRYGSYILSIRWPWATRFWKPTTPRRSMIKAAALILAEIERLDRAEARAAK